MGVRFGAGSDGMGCLVVSGDGWMRELVGVVVDCLLDRALAGRRGILRRSGGSLVVVWPDRWWFDGWKVGNAHTKQTELLVLEVQVRLDRAALQQAERLTCRAALGSCCCRQLGRVLPAGACAHPAVKSLLPFGSSFRSRFFSLPFGSKESPGIALLMLPLHDSRLLGSIPISSHARSTSVLAPVKVTWTQPGRDLDDATQTSSDSGRLGRLGHPDVADV